ncbi:Eco57I restriction-modification methylase domain-containing protein [Sphingobacterium spiritivorum]|uniref:Eco57I restriction-modification methylase domain-containing protein n=1 Tax=Sphingobacterium spiritivorum TaxID=258 RepID=UPI002E12B6A9|nr:Eco57I restriction-modification methylase domain-containing protein [Sphingobacterium spiritivorum]WQD34101.1 Eco57I restriction-modification methylase domain-containing protein [Sphingobacterium spiritivorum]
MKEKDLKYRLQQSFDFSIWKEILLLFFKKIDYFSLPKNLFTENNKVIDGRQIGTVKLDDGKQLAIFTVEVANNISIVRNRQGLREIAAKHIDQNIIHGALAFFYNKNQADYRFSFIAKEASLDLETGEFKKDETKPKRYTYLLGANEACTTPAKRMLVLADKKEKGEVNIKELKEVFSVEALNKDFFKTYKAHYEKFWKYLAEEENPFRAKLIDAEKETKDQQEKPIRDFVKKLLGRIVFLQFLEKKGWMGCDADTKEWTGGSPRFMYQLFEDFSNPSNFHSQCLTKLFFETLNTKRTNDVFQVKGLNGKLNGSRVPYLNGGLFEPEKNKATLEVDFPTDYFKELLEFFDQYNFTIDENSPDDHEVGIDPEMLGHIFENLLEDNRDKGAFYTPKEIVQYMCKESLIQYLLNTFREEKDIEDFIRLHTVTPFLADKENAVLLNKKLDDIKVCDPAIGSGAFPIGMLQEIFEAKRFIYPYLKTNEAFNPADVKKNIIQNSIYGVDLEKGAVDIAQLRFWLSLVVEELNPHPLPNLDYKIMQGNSLLESFEDVDLSQMGNTKSDIAIAEPIRDLFGNISESQMKMTFTNTENINKIQKLVNKFFRIEDAEEKKAIRDEINDLVLKHIEYNIELRENQLNRFISEAGNPEALKATARKKYNSYVADLNKVQETKAKLFKIHTTDERPYFLWQLYFMDVFEQGGFDVIIGNPPYIQLQKNGGSLAKIYENQSFETFQKTGDIYSLFYEKGWQLLKSKGVLTYITSNKWMRAGYGENTRKFFAEKTNPVLLIDFAGQKIFETATVDVNILMFTRDKNRQKTQACVVKENVLNKLSVFVRQFAAEYNFSTKESWIILNPIEQSIKLKIEAIGTPLKDWDINIYRGILTGYNEAFIIDGATKNKLIAEDSKSAEIIRPILRGRDIKRYSYDFSDLWLINTHNGIKEKGIKPINIDDYPAIKNHLDNYYPKLAKRADKGETPYNLRNCAYMEDFYKQKIVWGNLNLKASYAIAPEGYFVNAPCPMIVPANKYLLAVLNSKLADYYIRNLGVTRNGGYFEYKPMFIEQMPVPIISEMQQNKIAKLVSETVTSEVEKIIDKAIFKLYDLTIEEVNFIQSQ